MARVLNYPDCSWWEFSYCLDPPNLSLTSHKMARVLLGVQNVLGYLAGMKSEIRGNYVKVASVGA